MTTKNSKTKKGRPTGFSKKALKAHATRKANRAELAYQEIIDLCKKIERKRKAGYILFNKYNNVESGKIVYTSPFNKKCIAFREGQGWGSVVVHGSTQTYGRSTLLYEYRAGLKHLLEYKLLDPKYIKKLKDI